MVTAFVLPARCAAPFHGTAAAANDERFAATAGVAHRRRFGYRAMLDAAFAAFGSLRIVMYLPMLWTIHISTDSDQHSLLTWLGWLCANATMALWLYEKNARRGDRAVMISVANAAMCAVAVALIVAHRTV